MPKQPTQSQTRAPSWFMWVTRHRIWLAALAPIALTLALLIITLLLLEAADTFSPGPKTAGQSTLQTIGDLFALATMLAGTFLVPFGLISAAIMAALHFNGTRR